MYVKYKYPFTMWIATLITIHHQSHILIMSKIHWHTHTVLLQLGYILHTNKRKLYILKSNNKIFFSTWPNVFTLFYYFIHYQLKIQLFIISFSKNLYISQTILDTSDKRYKIEGSGRGRGINDNSKGALIEEYKEWAEDDFLS